VVYALSLANGQSCGKSGGCTMASAPCCSQWGYCGSGAGYCGTGCQSGSCIGSRPPPPPPPSSPPPSSPSGGTVRCGASWQGANDGCGSSCTSDSSCSNGQRCYRDLTPRNCGSNPPSQPPPTSPPTSPPTGGGKTVSGLISKSAFTSALSQCGVNRPDIYDSLVSGFTAPLNGGLNELALLTGNLAHESGAFQYTEEIACAGVTQVTGACPYGLYHGRGYIQLSWDYNYRAAASYWNNQEILTNPDIVKNNPKVNWQTVQWFWITSVQPTFLRSGYTLGASVRAINGGLECNSGPINAQRVKYIQCFQQAMGVPVDTNTRCPAAAVGDSDSMFASGSLASSFPLALIVLGSITLVLALVAVVLILLVIKKSKIGGERV